MAKAARGGRCFAAPEGAAPLTEVRGFHRCAALTALYVELRSSNGTGTLKEDWFEENSKQLATDHQRTGTIQTIRGRSTFSRYLLHGIGRRPHRHHRAERFRQIDPSRDSERTGKSGQWGSSDPQRHAS